MEYDNYIEQTRKYYNNRFAEGTTLGLNSEEQLRWYYIENAIKTNFLSINRPLQILDAGCGDGRFSNLLSKYGHVTACDLADKGVTKGHTNYPSVSFYEVDLSRQLPMNYFSEPFDMIISTEVIEHIFDQQIYIQNLVQCLKPGGCLILTTPNGALYSKYFHGNREGQAFEFWLRRDELKELLEKHHLVISDTTTFNGDWFLSFRDNPFPYNLLSNRLMKKLIRIFGLRKMIGKYLERRGQGLYLLIVARKNG